MSIIFLQIACQLEWNCQAWQHQRLSFSQYSSILTPLDDISRYLTRCDRWEERKGWKILIESYFSAFAATDDVLLVLLTNAYHSSSDFQVRFLLCLYEYVYHHIQKRIEEFAGDHRPRIHILNPGLPQVRCHKNSNAILPYRVNYQLYIKLQMHLSCRPVVKDGVDLSSKRCRWNSRSWRPSGVDRRNIWPRKTRIPCV